MKQKEIYSLLKDDKVCRNCFWYEDCGEELEVKYKSDNIVCDNFDLRDELQENYLDRYIERKIEMGKIEYRDAWFNYIDVRKNEK